MGYFDIPVDHVYGDSVVLDYLASKRIATGDLVVVSPDVGGVARCVRARAGPARAGSGAGRMGCLHGAPARGAGCGRCMRGVGA